MNRQGSGEKRGGHAPRSIAPGDLVEWPDEFVTSLRPSPRRPLFWDAHAHVFGDPARYPLRRDRRYDPPLAPVDAYLEFLDDMGLDRGVLVQPSVYGFDNRCLLDALDEAGGRLFGIAVPAPDTSARELERMHMRGVRGIRIDRVDGGGIDNAALRRWGPVLYDLGWHVEMHLPLRESSGVGWMRDRFNIPIVIDHMGRPDLAGKRGVDFQLAFLLYEVRAGMCTAKLSAPYLLSREPAPWPDVTPLARALLSRGASPSCIWGSDWPHIGAPGHVESKFLIRALVDWCPSMEQRAKLLARPGKLFPPD